MKKKIPIFLFNGFSDWEISYLTPEINKSEEFELIYFSKDGQKVTSMGGLVVKPSKSLSELNIDEIELLILPGGTAWEKGENAEMEQFVKKVFEKGEKIAAICAATTFLGQQGMLDQLKHTSNHVTYLKAVAPQYKGGELYQDTLAERDKNIITANGIAPIEFAREIFKAIGLYTEEEVEKWFQLFKNGVWSE